MLEGFLFGGVNYLGGSDIKGDLGKSIRSSLRFEFTGKVQYGYDEVGDIPMALYNAGGGIQIASASSIETLLNSALPGREMVDDSPQTAKFVA
jgi:hypothetical protein